MTTARYASRIDAAVHGEHRAGPLPVSRFPGRLASAEHPHVAGRYHLYGGWFCPRSQQATIQLAVNGLAEAVSVSYVDGLRDGRGWAFRERTGPDPVNGFTLLREAYAASVPGYAGPVSVPVLWDCHAGRIVSTDPDTIDLDLATFVGATNEMYPEDLRLRIDGFTDRIHALGRGITRAVYHAPARSALAAQLRELDDRLHCSCYLVGDRLTVADVRLWVLLVRYDAGPNAHGAAGPPLTAFPALWDWARALYRHPAFAATTDFRAFTAPLTRLLDWTAPPSVR